MRPEERLELLEDWLERLRGEVAEKPVLVEGIHDREALLELGCVGTIITFHDGDSILGTAERIAGEHRQIILLTDWDRTGGTIHARMKETLTALGVRCDERLRRELAMLVSKETRSLEGVPGFLERLRFAVGRRP